MLHTHQGYDSRFRGLHEYVPQQPHQQRQALTPCRLFCYSSFATLHAVHATIARADEPSAAKKHLRGKLLHTLAVVVFLRHWTSIRVKLAFSRLPRLDALDPDAVVSVAPRGFPLSVLGAQLGGCDTFSCQHSYAKCSTEGRASLFVRWASRKKSINIRLNQSQQHQQHY